MTTRTTWIIGRGGLLGCALDQQIGAADQFVNAPIDWSSAGAPAAIADEAARFLDVVGDSQWRIIWCAGAGIIGTPPAVLEHETAIFRSLLDNASGPGTVFLTSSAGGVYGGSDDIPITERSTPTPLSDYGSNKLIQEGLLATWADETGGRGVIGRVANLYGPGQRLTKPQGLISQICLATLRRRPVTLYVSLDTLRDYVFVDDCSLMVARCLDHASDLEPGSTVTKILASGSSVSIGALLAQARRVLGRAPSVVMVPSIRTAQQGNAMSFKSMLWPLVSSFALTPLPVGIHRTSEHLRGQLRLGTLT